MRTQTEWHNRCFLVPRAPSRSHWLPSLTVCENTSTSAPILCCSLYRCSCALVPGSFGHWGTSTTINLCLLFSCLANSFLPSFFHLSSNFFSLLHARHKIRCFQIWSDLSSPLCPSCSPNYCLGTKLVALKRTKMRHPCGYKPCHCSDTADTPDILDLLTLLSPLMASLPGLYPSSHHLFKRYHLFQWPLSLSDKPFLY